MLLVAPDLQNVAVSRNIAMFIMPGLHAHNIPPSNLKHNLQGMDITHEGQCVLIRNIDGDRIEDGKSIYSIFFCFFVCMI